MSTNGMNYSLYNTMPYPQVPQQQTLYGQQFPPPPPPSMAPPMMPPYNPYQMYPTIQSHPHPPPTQRNTYDHIIRSAAETLAAFSGPPENTGHSNQQPSRHSHFNHSRRPPTNSSSSANSTHMFYCETCRIACGGHATYQAHLNGSKHKKKELNSQTAQSSANATTTNSFRCELCDITCTSADAYKAHLDGSKHEKAMKLHRKLGKSIPPVELPLNNTASTTPSNSQEDKSSTDSTPKLIGEEYIEITYDESRKPIVFYCKLCDCKFNDANAKDAHLKGKRHRLSYRKKVDPNYQIDGNHSTNNKPTSPKQQQQQPRRPTESIPDNPSLPRSIITQSTADIDEDTRCLMTLHEQIIPPPYLLNLIEQFITAIESALKSCSDQLGSSSSTSEIAQASSPLMGVSRAGLLAKLLLIKSDRQFHLVVMCTDWPTMNLLEKLSNLLLNNFEETWRNRIEIQCLRSEEKIQVQTTTDQGTMTAWIFLTSTAVQQQESPKGSTSEQLLSKQSCLDALYAMHSIRWFQSQVSIRKHASALIRCLRYKASASSRWRSLPSELLEILIEYALSKSPLPVVAFRSVLECLAGGFVLSNGPGLKYPWRNESDSVSVLDSLTAQERHDITYEAQMGLRWIAFGQLNQWLEQNDLSQVMVSSEKRSHPDDSNETSAKRPCLSSTATEDR